MLCVVVCGCEPILFFLKINFVIFVINVPDKYGFSSHFET